MSAINKKQIIVAISLAVLAIGAVILFMVYMKGDTIDKYVFLFKGTEYSGKTYTTENVKVPMNDGKEIELTYITYLQDQKEYQFGFSIPEEERLTREVPYDMEIVNTKSNETVSREPLFAAEKRDGRYYYRTVFSNANIDVEASPDLTLIIRDSDGKELASHVIVTAKTLFTSAELDSLQKREYTKDASESGSDSSSESTSSNSSESIAA